MRFDGKLDKWNDDRGFGFITPTRGGEPVFVHISAFARDGHRPQLGETLTFEVEPAGDGKKRAINVLRPGSRSPAAAPQSYRHPPRRADTARGRQPRSFLGGVAAAIAMVGLGGYAYTEFNSRLASRAQPEASQAVTRTATPATVTFRCDGRIHCSQMTSCDEAKFFLRNCPGTKMDGNGDGIPCESQWCSR